MDIKELYRKRKEAFSAAARVYQESLDTYSKEKKKMISEAVVIATVEAEKAFYEKYGKDEETAHQLLVEANTELALLRCPNERSHQKPEDRYYRCETCGFVWDDTPNAHP
jgi:hypothetical protein